MFFRHNYLKEQILKKVFWRKVMNLVVVDSLNSIMGGNREREKLNGEMMMMKMMMDKQIK